MAEHSEAQVLVALRRPLGLGHRDHEGVADTLRDELFRPTEPPLTGGADDEDDIALGRSLLNWEDIQRQTGERDAQHSADGDSTGPCEASDVPTPDCALGATAQERPSAPATASRRSMKSAVSSQPVTAWQATPVLLTG